jgi:hypothetical protein
MEEKKLNREKTIENIRKSGNIIDVVQFEEEINLPDSDEFIIDAAMLCDAKVVYES